jgi:hypothetical protein
MKAMQILDGRKLAESGEVPSTDLHSFAFLTGQKSAVKEWDDPAAIMHQYFPEVEQMIRKNIPGADHPDAKILIFDHVLRIGGKGLKDKQKAKSDGTAHPDAPAWDGYAGMVHSDATFRSGHTRAKDQLLGTNEVETKYKGLLPASWGAVRPSLESQKKLFGPESTDHDSPDGEGGEHMIVNAWRPIAGPVMNWGLAVMDGRTIDQRDVHPTILYTETISPEVRLSGEVSELDSKVVDLHGESMPVRIGETVTPLHEDRHRWIYYPNMMPDEVLLLKVFDSRRDGRTRFGSHAAFHDTTGHGDPQAHRQSIEVRCLVILPPSAGAAGASKL